jgi:transcriptional regulator with XRE-family HTH domain
MSTANRYEAGTPPARVEFAQRLRALRVPRGFHTARSLARALGIDENRYTRYERAEVEPDLSMIRRICEILRVTPDALLGDGRQSASDSASPARQAPPDGTRSSPPPVTDLQTSAWMLAEAATDLLGPNGSSAPTPLMPVTETCKTYKALVERPFETISDLLAHPDLSKVDLPTANVLRQSIDQFVSHIKSRT